MYAFLEFISTPRLYFVIILKIAGDFEKKHIDGVAHSVHLLVNFSDCRSIPGDAWMMRRVPSTKHERLGYMVFAGTQKWLQLIMSVILRFMGFNRFRFFETEREARNFLHGQIPKEEMPAE